MADFDVDSVIARLLEGTYNPRPSVPDAVCTKSSTTPTSLTYLKEMLHCVGSAVPCMSLATSWLCRVPILPARAFCPLGANCTPCKKARETFSHLDRFRVRKKHLSRPLYYFYYQHTVLRGHPTASWCSLHCMRRAYVSVWA